jgi:hypothetical protein
MYFPQEYMNGDSGAGKINQNGAEEVLKEVY